MHVDYVVKRVFLKYRSILRCGLVCLLSGFLMTTHAAIYKQVAANGAVSFSDTPNANASLVVLQPVNVATTSEVPASKANVDSQKKTYKKFAITQPHDQQTFQNQREIALDIQLQPDLQEGDKLEIWLDGKATQQTSSTHIMLGSLNRGEHTLQAKLLGSDGKALVTTEMVTFYMHYGHQ